MPQDLALIGEHQRANCALAGMAMQLFGNSTRIDQDAIFRGARRAEWPARLQKLKPGPLSVHADDIDVWLDGGHNPHGAEAIAKHFQRMEGKTALVCAMLASKDATGFFLEFRDLRPDVFTLPNAPGHKSAEPQALADAARIAGLNAIVTAGLEEALGQAAASGAARILICGSLYLAGEVLFANDEIPV
jgi:dihydrofolate synthase/folylpolyglutamate synthase